MLSGFRTAWFPGDGLGTRGGSPGSVGSNQGGNREEGQEEEEEEEEEERGKQ